MRNWKAAFAGMVSRAAEQEFRLRFPSDSRRKSRALRFLCSKQQMNPLPEELIGEGDGYRSYSFRWQSLLVMEISSKDDPSHGMTGIPQHGVGMAGSEVFHSVVVVGL
jgi:hypothetical protein